MGEPEKVSLTSLTISRRQVIEEHPQFISTDRHLMQGYLDFEKYPVWDSAKHELSGVSKVIGSEPYRVVIALNGYKLHETAGDCNIEELQESGLAALSIRRLRNETVHWLIRFTKRTREDQMTPRDIVLNQIQHRQTVPVPYTLDFERDVGARLDQHFGGAAWRGRLVPYIARCGGACKSGNEKLDDAHYRDAFGTVWRTDKEPPSVEEPGLKAPTLRGYAFPSPGMFLDPAAKAATKKRIAESSASFTIIEVGMCLWPSWYVRGFEETLLDCIAEEDFYAELLDRFTDLTLALIKESAHIPADALMMGDDWGDQRGVLIGPERWRRTFKPRYSRIFEAIHAQGKLAIMHCCGSVAAIMGDIVEIGLDVLESVQPEAAGMNPYALKKAWGDKITFWGCLGSQSTIPFAAPAEVRQEIRRLCNEMGRGGGYILAPAKALRPETPTENAVAIVEEFLDNSASL